MHKIADLTISKAKNALKLNSQMEVGDLMIENERLKTTIMILNQKINEQTDTY